MGNVANHCLRELLKQDYRNLEYIFVDDGSTDNSLDVCRRISEEDSRVRVFSTENRGSGPARNYGINQSKGEFIYFPDADDVLKADAISTLMKRVNDYPDADLLVFGFTNVKENGTILNVRSYPDKAFNAEDLRNDYSRCMGTGTPLGIQGAPWNKFFKMSVIRDNKIEYPPLRRHQDEGFISRYMCFAQKVVFMSNVLYTYVVNDIRKTWSKYPVDYYKAAIGLNEVRKETILRWNPNDITTHEFIQREYICNIVRSLELMFSPKLNKAGIGKIDYISNILDESELLNKEKPSILSPYQSIVLRLLNISKYLAIPVLYIKVLSNRLGLVR
jgi:glycosyltransferase involved in cell wall biosynthesis